MNDEHARWLETGRLAELGLLSTELVHELRQPLFAVKALAQMMAGEPTADPRMQTLLEQLGHLEGVVDRWAATGRRPGGAPRPVALQPAVQAGVALLLPRARSTQKILDLRVEGPQAAVMGDPVGIRQITANLVANALDAARSRVEVHTQGPILRVRDDGPGIPESVRARIFEPFFTTKPPGQGTGLGLAITAHLVRGAGGELSCHPLSRGTLFEVSFAAVGVTPVTG